MNLNKTIKKPITLTHENKNRKKLLIGTTVTILCMGLLIFSFTIASAAENSEPKACFDWSPKNPSAGETVAFSASCTSTDGTITEYAWDFQDDGNDDAWNETVYHIYPSQGTYTVELWVKESSGQTDHVWENITVTRSGGGGEGIPGPQSILWNFRQAMWGFNFVFGVLVLIMVSWFIIAVLIALWVYSDAEKRGEDAVIWLIIILISGIVGLIIWLIVRPEKKEPEEEKEEKTESDVKYCPNCGSEVESDDKFCSECGEEL